MTTQDIISSGLLEQYVIGDLSAAEREQVERWRNEMPEVYAELALIEQAMESYAHGHAVNPSASVKRHVEQQIFGSAKVVSMPAEHSKVISMGKRWMGVAAASISLLLLSSALAFYFFNESRSAKQELAAASVSLDSAKSELNNTKSDMTAMRSDIGMMRDKYARAVSLDGLATAPQAAARIYWMKNSGEVYVDPAYMPVAPAGKEYQLWAIVDGKPVSGGMIKSADGRNFNIQKMKSFGKAEAFAITLEDAGGHEQPQGEMYVMGKI